MHAHTQTLLSTHHVWFNCFEWQTVLHERDKSNDNNRGCKKMAEKLLKTFSFSVENWIKLKRNNGWKLLSANVTLLSC